jgi:hypothetical protein
MRQGMTDICPGVPAKLCDDQASPFMKPSPHVQLKKDYYSMIIRIISCMIPIISIACPGFSSL